MTMFAEVLKQLCLQNKLVNSWVALRIVKKGLHGQLHGMQDILHTIICQSTVSDGFHASSNNGPRRLVKFFAVHQGATILMFWPTISFGLLQKGSPNEDD